MASSGFAPFADANLEAGGMMTDLLRRAITVVDANYPPSFDFVNDRSSHLDELLRESGVKVARSTDDQAPGK